MSKNIPVAGQVHLSRSSTVSAAIINTNSEGFKAFKESQKRAMRLEDVEFELELLRSAIDKLLTGGGNG